MKSVTTTDLVCTLHTWTINGERDSRSGQSKNIYTHFVHSLFLGHLGSIFGKLFVNNNNEPNKNSIEFSHYTRCEQHTQSTCDSSVWSINAAPDWRWTVHLLYLFIKIDDESFFLRIRFDCHSFHFVSRVFNLTVWFFFTHNSTILLYLVTAIHATQALRWCVCAYDSRSSRARIRIKHFAVYSCKM